MFNYIKETKLELKYVSWPTWAQAVAMTVAVIIVSILTAVFLGLLDYIFNLGLKSFII